MGMLWEVLKAFLVDKTSFCAASEAFTKRRETSLRPLDRACARMVGPRPAILRAADPYARVGAQHGRDSVRAAANLPTERSEPQRRGASCNFVEVSGIVLR